MFVTALRMSSYICVYRMKILSLHLGGFLHGLVELISLCFNLALIVPVGTGVMFPKPSRPLALPHIFGI